MVHLLEFSLMQDSQIKVCAYLNVIPTWRLRDFAVKPETLILDETAIMRAILFIACMLVATASFSQISTEAKPEEKKKILVHITHGPENPTRAALGFLVARTAIEEGHSVTMFLAGDAVNLMKDSVLNTLTGVGTGKLKDHYEVINASKTRIYLSGNSSKARGLTDKDIAGKPAEFAMPQVLVRLSVEADRVFTY